MITKIALADSSPSSVSIASVVQQDVADLVSRSGNSVVIGGSLSINPTGINVNGAAAISSDLTVNGNITAAGGVTASGPINKVTLTPPANGSTLTVLDGKTVTFNDTITVTGTDGSTLDIGNGGVLTPQAFPNLVVNGACEVSQFNGTAALTGQTTAYVVDGISFTLGGTPGTGRFTLQQVTDAPTGFLNSAKVSTTTADSSLASTDFYALQVPIEGYRCIPLMLGTASATPINILFAVKAHRSGLYGAGVTNGTRSYVFNFTINSADTWEWKTVSIPGDTSGTWTVSNTAGLSLYITLAAGSSSQLTAGSWQSSFGTTTAGCVNGVGATTDTFQITGVVVTPYDLPTSTNARRLFRPFDFELRLCKRYWESSYDYGVVPGTVTAASQFVFAATGLASGTLTGNFTMEFKETKRSGPTCSLYSPVTGTSGKIRDTLNNQDLTATIADTGTQRFDWFATESTSSNQIKYAAHWVTDARL